MSTEEKDGLTLVELATKAVEENPQSPCVCGNKYTTLPGIYAALAQAMRIIGPIGKKGQNKDQNYAYRRIDDIMNRAHDVFLECGILVIPDVLAMEFNFPTADSGLKRTHCWVRMQYTFHCLKDGTRHVVHGVGEGMDSNDKALAKAQSMALKYAIGQLLLVPFKGMEDGDRHGGGDSDNPLQPDKPSRPPRRPPQQTKAQP